ncbi:MAG TPA: hypothetical protein VF546_11105 [Pyrinomonadaceae bacterium]
MGGRLVSEGPDGLLRAYLQAAAGPAAEAALARLLAEAAPVVAGIIRGKLQVSLSPADGSARNQDALEVNAEVQAALVAELRRLKAEQPQRAIADFRGYVAVTTYHACYEHLRRKYPRRHSLKNKLRYLLNSRAEFALWETTGRGWLCGFAGWRRDADVSADEPRTANLPEAAHVAARLAGGEPARASLTELVAATFAEAGGPLELDELVGVVASLQGVTEAARAEDEDGQGAASALPDPRASAAEEVEQRRYLEVLWREICELPPRQRAALLLNLRDAEGRGVLALFPLTGVANVRRIAAALEVPAEEFAEWWPELPFDDARIAARLGLTRQQVINLRKSARARLARRMKDF